MLHVAGDAREGVFEAAGFGGCLTWSFETAQAAPSSAVIERAAAAALVLPDGQGWIDLPADAVGGGRPLSAWLGRDEQAAAAAHGSTLMVIGDAAPDAAWLLVTLDDHPAAIELLRVETKGGWVAWIPTHNASGMTRGADGYADGCA